MANDIDKTSPHYKGDFGSIYEVNKKFPTGGVAGDFVVIEGWAHYWNADRATWCVNAERDSYWDELITNIIEKFKLVRGATYMGVASLDTVPAKVIGAKMYYFATVAGTYKNFGDLVVPQGINVLYSENGSSWVNTTLLEVAQELGVGTKKVVSQKALNDALNLKANQSSVNEALAKKADKEEMNRLLGTKANTADVNTKFTEEQKRVDGELAKKFDKESVVQESGEAEDKVMSQKAVSDKLSDLSGTVLEKVNSLKSESFILTDLERIENKCVINNAELIDNNATFSSIVDLSKVDGIYKTLSVKAIETEELLISYIFKDSNYKTLLVHTNSHAANNRVVCATGTDLYIPIPENATTFMFSYYKDDIAEENGYPIFDGVKFYDHDYYGRKNFTSNAVLEKLISELYLNSDFKYSLDEIFSVTVCKAYKVFETRNEYHNGFFMQIGRPGAIKAFVIATKAYSTKEEAIKNISNDTYFHKDGAYAIIDLNAVNDFNSGVQYFVDITDSVRNLEFSPVIKSKFISPQYTTEFDIFTTKTTIPDYPNTPLVFNGMYISWKPLDATVVINRVRFSVPVTLADSYNIKLITVDPNTLKIKSTTALKLQNDLDFVDVSVRLEPNDLLGFSFESGVQSDFIHFRKFTEEDKWAEDYVNLSSELSQQNFTESNFLFDISYEFSKTYDKVWSGLQGLFIGDSITWYEWYPDAIGQLTGCEVYNRGGNGTTVASYQSGLSFAYRSELPTDDDKNAKFSGFPSKADKVFILGGINDWGYARRNNPNFNLGNINESATKSTFAGAFKTLLSNVRKKYLNADIYVLLMYDVYTLSTSTFKHGEITLNDVDGDIESGHTVIKLEKNGIQFTLDDMRDIESEIAKMYGCKVIDLREVGFSAFVKSDRNHYFVTDDGGVNGDGLHMNKTGSVKMAKYVLSQIL